MLSHYQPMDRYQPKERLEIKGRPRAVRAPLPERGYFGKVEQIGYGAVGTVYRAISTSGKSMVAVKVLETEDLESGTIEFRMVRRVMKVLKKLAPGEQVITPALRCFQDAGRGTYEIVFPLRQGSLHKVLSDRRWSGKGGLHLDIVSVMCRQIATALRVTHAAGVIHCDVKPANILISNEATSQVELTDFGSAIADPEKTKPVGGIQTLCYRAPEILYRLEKPPTFALDAWSFGVLLVELFQGDSPFQGNTPCEMMSCISEVLGPPPKVFYQKISKESDLERTNALFKWQLAKSWVRRRSPFDKKELHRLPLFFDLVEKLLVYEPEERLSFVEINLHPFLAPSDDQCKQPTQS